MFSIFLVHAAADAAFVRELTAFLEAGCDEITVLPDTEIRAGFDLISTAETGMEASAVVLLLSTASNPARWARDRWEPVLFAPDNRARVATVSLEECGFPALLRRGSGFFDAAPDSRTAMRRLKRWLLGLRSGVTPNLAISSELETLYSELADRPGVATASGEVAQRFAQQAAGDFSAIAWVPAHHRTAIQIAGELGAQLGMTLDGEPEANFERIREVLAARRCLVVFDAPGIPLDAIMPRGRTSVLFTGSPVRIAEDDRSFAMARRLVIGRRYAEAYVILRDLLEAGVEESACARELVWICEHWDRVEEANELRFRCSPIPSHEQLRLF